MINTLNPNNPQEKVRSALAGNTSGFSNKKKPKPRLKLDPKMIFGGLLFIMLLIGGAAGLYLTQVNQDLRQQASGGTYRDCYGGVSDGDFACAGFGPGSCKVCKDGLFDDASDSSCVGMPCFSSSTPTNTPGPSAPTSTPNPEDPYECHIDSPTDCGGNAKEECHCTGGDACTGTKCDGGVGASCRAQGRSYCTNWQGDGTTCCVAGYVCSSTLDGCFSSTPTQPPVVGGGCGDACNENSDCANGTFQCGYRGGQGSGTVCWKDSCDNDPEPTDPPNNPTATPTTPPDSTPTPTTPVGPQCHEITAYNTTGGSSTPLTGNEDDNLASGVSTLRFVCAANSLPLASGYSYQFRIWEPCATGAVELAAVDNAVSYSIGAYGDYAAQCAVCNDATGVCDWETYTPTSCASEDEVVGDWTGDSTMPDPLGR